MVVKQEKSILTTCHDAQRPIDPDSAAMLREHEALVEPLLRGADDAVRREPGRRVYDEADEEMEGLRESRESFEAVRESEARFRAIFENSAVGMARVAPDGRWLEVNQRLCDIVGYSRDEMMAKTFTEVTHHKAPYMEYRETWV